MTEPGRGVSDAWISEAIPLKSTKLKMRLKIGSAKTGSGRQPYLMCSYLEQD